MGARVTFISNFSPGGFQWKPKGNTLGGAPLLQEK